MNKKLANVFSILLFAFLQSSSGKVIIFFFGMEFIHDESAYYWGFIEILDGMQGNSDRIWFFNWPVVLFYFFGKRNFISIETCQMLLFYGT